MYSLHTLWADEPRHEACFLELYYDCKYVAMIILESENQKPDIEFPSKEYEETMIVRHIGLDCFLQLLEIGIEEFQKSYPLSIDECTLLTNIHMRYSEESEKENRKLGLYFNEKLIAHLVMESSTADAILEFPPRDYPEEIVLRRIDLCCFQKFLEMCEKTIRCTTRYLCDTKEKKTI